MGSCQSIHDVTKSASIALGPSPSILPRKEFDDVRDRFAFDKELGRGTISVMHRVLDKHTNAAYACKSISKLKVCSQQELRDVKQEIKIFKHVSTGHPHIAQLIQSYEDMTDVHIVMEECTGGDLFDRILRDKVFSEASAAAIFRSIMSIVQHCHAMNVVHRDIKPEGFMFLNESPDAPLKAVDFGCSAFIYGTTLDEVIGSAHYVAPDMLRGTYGREVDVWSAGVLLYVLLCGYPPFNGNTDGEIFEQIVSAPLNLKSEPWPKVSPSAKDLVRKMLLRDPKRRLTAEQVMQHAWFTEQAQAPRQPAAPMVLICMRQFAQFNKLKKEALKVIVGSMPEAEIEGMHKIFQSIDRDASGNITAEELRKGLKKQGASLGMTEVSQVLDGVDMDGDHMVDYMEFLAATMKDMARTLSDRDKHEKLLQAFRHFDLDNSGHITVDELKVVLSEEGKELSDEVVHQILVEVDKDNDGKIDIQEFSAMLAHNDGAPTFRQSRRLRIEPLLSRKLREVPLSDTVQEEDDKHAGGKDKAQQEDRPSASSTFSVSMSSGRLSSGSMSRASSLNPSAAFDESAPSLEEPAVAVVSTGISAGLATVPE